MEKSVAEDELSAAVLCRDLNSLDDVHFGVHEEMM